MKPPRDTDELERLIEEHAARSPDDAALMAIRSKLIAAGILEGLKSEPPGADEHRVAAADLAAEYIRQVILDRREFDCASALAKILKQDPYRWNDSVVQFGYAVIALTEMHQRAPTPDEVQGYLREIYGREMEETTFKGARKKLGLESVVAGQIGRPKKSPDS